MNQLYVYTQPLPLSLSPLHPTPLGGMSWAPVLYSSFPLAVLHRAAVYGVARSRTPLQRLSSRSSSVYMSILFSRFVSPACSLSVSTCPLSESVSLFLPSKQAHLYHLSRFPFISQSFLVNWWILLPILLFLFQSCNFTLFKY